MQKNLTNSYPNQIQISFWWNGCAGLREFAFTCQVFSLSQTSRENKTNLIESKFFDRRQMNTINVSQNVRL